MVEEFKFLVGEFCCQYQGLLLSHHGCVRSFGVEAEALLHVYRAVLESCHALEDFLERGLGGVRGAGKADEECWWRKRTASDGAHRRIARGLVKVEEGETSRLVKEHGWELPVVGGGVELGVGVAEEALAGEVEIGAAAGDDFVSATAGGV